jgi:hypothetical protein
VDRLEQLGFLALIRRCCSHLHRHREEQHMCDVATILTELGAAK